LNTATPATDRFGQLHLSDTRIRREPRDDLPPRHFLKALHFLA
jgi:hypothetical protein